MHAASDQFSPIPVEARNAENTIILDENEDPAAPVRDAQRAREQEQFSKETETVRTFMQNPPSA